MSSPTLFKAKVRYNSQVTRGHYLLGLMPEGIPANPLPGQFYMLGLPNGADPLLKRPFGYFRMREGVLELLYRVRGRATSLMSGLEEGDYVELLGPLGNGYPLPKERKIPVVVAGGVGIASVYPLIESLDRRAIVFYGGRNADELLFLNDIRSVSKELAVSTDDGSIGYKGTVVDALRDFLSVRSPSRYALYACGPKGMLKALQGLGAGGYLSMEEKMACGYGVCLGCAVKTPQGYKRACKEGPVFRAEDVIFE